MDTNATKYVVLKEEAKWDSGHRLPASFEVSDESCESVVEVTCQEFSKCYYKFVCLP